MTSRRDEAFAPADWGLLAAVAVMWGSSFLLIEVALGDLRPETIAWLRIALGAATLGLLPAARRPVARADLPLVAVLGAVWMAAPFSLFAFAQQSIPSSLAGMVNGAAPLFTVLIATAWTRRAPTSLQLGGFGLGFAGVVAVNWPSGDAGGAGTSTVAGALLVVAATFCYGIAFNLAEPLERRNGVLPVIWRAQLAATALTVVPGALGATRSSMSWSTAGAMLVLGALSTGLAFALFVMLVGRVGASRGSITVYFIPVVAIVLGVSLRGEVVGPLALVGTGLILAGAFLTSRRTRLRQVG